MFPVEGLHNYVGHTDQVAKECSCSCIAFFFPSAAATGEIPSQQSMHFGQLYIHLDYSL
jgi:hypothetical protein